MYTHKITDINLQKMTELALALSPHLGAGDVVLLNGDLGAGKSTFARIIIQSHLGDIDVPSPTFTLVQSYNAKNFEIWHMDLYRLETPAEILELGVEESFSTNLCLIEWGENAISFIPPTAININIENGKNADCRNLSFVGEAWQKILNNAGVI